MPYWAELWPAGLALARALPDDLAGLTRRRARLRPRRAVARRGRARGARDGDRLGAPTRSSCCARTPRATGSTLDAERRATGARSRARFDLALAADVLYEERNVEPLLELLPRLAPEVWLAEPGRPHAAAFLARARERWRRRGARPTASTASRARTR